MNNIRMNTDGLGIGNVHKGEEGIFWPVLRRCLLWTSLRFYGHVVSLLVPWADLFIRKKSGLNVLRRLYISDYFVSTDICLKSVALCPCSLTDHTDCQLPVHCKLLFLILYTALLLVKVMGIGSPFDAPWCSWLLSVHCWKWCLYHQIQNVLNSKIYY